MCMCMLMYICIDLEQCSVIVLDCLLLHRFVCVFYLFVHVFSIRVDVQ